MINKIDKNFSHVRKWWDVKPSLQLPFSRLGPWPAFYRPTEASHVYIAGDWGASANGVEGQHPAGDPGDEVPGDRSRGRAPGIFCHFRHFRCK